MRHFVKPMAILSGLFALSACAIEIDGGDHNALWDHYSDVHMDVGDSRIVIEQRFNSREEAALAMDQKMAAVRDKGCLITSANSWHEIRGENDKQHRGYRLIASCPDNVAIF